jgi:hypothetical protein
MQMPLYDDANPGESRVLAATWWVRLIDGLSRAAVAVWQGGWM